MQDAAQPQGMGTASAKAAHAERDAGSTEGAGEVRFATLDERDAVSVRLERTGHVVAELEGIGPSARGRLGEVIDEAIEEALAARGATAPGITSGSDRDATLSDQLFRTRRVGGRGLAIVLGPLRAATNAVAWAAIFDWLACASSFARSAWSYLAFWGARSRQTFAAATSLSSF